MLLLLLLSAFCSMSCAAATLDLTAMQWREKFSREVDYRVEVPVAAQAHYIALLKQTLAAATIETPAQVVLLIDRSPLIQVAFVMLHADKDEWFLVGATSVSTGKVGSYNHFLTPLGVFSHSLENPDYRAEGTLNENHIRGYGLRGMRVFDFGWQQAQRGWGDGAVSEMRLQMHATDPNVLQARLGSVASEGCIRIPATLNKFLDIYGLIDALYEHAASEGRNVWILNPDRQPISTPGQYMVIVDSLAQVRPPWSPSPVQRNK